MSKTIPKQLPLSSTPITRAVGFDLKQSLASSNDNNKSFLKTWQLALAIGIPSAAIIAYFIYKRRQSRKPIEKDTNNAKGKNNESVEASSDLKKEEKPVLPPVSKTQLEQAVDFKNDGNKYFQQKKYQEALDCYSKAIDLCPKENRDELPKFYQNRAASYENLKNYVKVIEDCDKALELDPNYTKALLRRAKAAEQIEEFQMAFEDLTALCILENFQNEKNIIFADKLVKTLGERMCKEKFKNREFVPISKHFVNNFYIGLMNDPIYNNKQLLAEIESNENRDEVENIQNAIVEFNNGDYEKCIENCTSEVNKLNGKYVNEALNLRGSLYMLRCQFNESINDFNELLSNENASKRLKSNTLIKMTALNLQRNEEYEAFVNYDKAAKLDENNEDIYCNRAQVLAMKGRFEDSFKDFDKAIELNPAHKIACLQKAFFQFRQFNSALLSSEYFANNESNGSEQPQLSLKSKLKLEAETRKLEPLLEKYSDVPEAYSLFAQILSEQKEFEKAEKFYKLALDKDPFNAALVVQRALNHMQWTNQFDNAISMLNEAIKIDETCEFAYETLASIEIQRGNLVLAVELFAKAINLTRNEESMLNLCSMLVGAQTQAKILSKFSSSAFSIVANAGKN